MSELTTEERDQLAAAVEATLRERLNETMIAAQSSLSDDRCEVLHPDEWSPDTGGCVECTEHAADLLHDGWDERIIAPVLAALTATQDVTP